MKLKTELAATILGMLKNKLRLRESWVQNKLKQLNFQKKRAYEIPTRPIQGDTMGRVKSIAIKTLGNDLIRDHIKKFSPDFDSNKKALGDITEIKSKKVRNVLAGYITKKMKGMKHPEVKEAK